MESARDFLDSIEEFLKTKAHAQALAREKLGMPSEMSKNESDEWKHKDPDFGGRKLVISSLLLLMSNSQSSQGFRRTDCKAFKSSTDCLRESVPSQVQKSSG